MGSDHKCRQHPESFQLRRSQLQSSRCSARTCCHPGSLWSLWSSAPLQKPAEAKDNPRPHGLHGSSSPSPAGLSRKAKGIRESRALSPLSPQVLLGFSREPSFPEAGLMQRRSRRLATPHPWGSKACSTHQVTNFPAPGFRQDWAWSSRSASPGPMSRS